MKITFYAIIIFILSAVLVQPVQAVVLANAGKANYTIVIPSKPSPTDATAAKELKEHLEKVTGAGFNIIRENMLLSDNKLIFVGQTEWAEQNLPKTDWRNLGSDGIILRTIGNNIVLTGGEKRGGLYAVYTFLEDIVGVRWWSNNESFIPNKSTLRIKDLNIRYIPKIKCREAHFYEPNNYTVYAARSKQNGHFQRIPFEYSGHYNILGWCHTFYKLLPPEIYFAQHPEWYSLIDGKRTFNGAQLCLTNEEMRKELVKNALEWIKQEPDAGIISISQNDWLGECQCSNCEALKNKEQSSAGPIIQFVNKVADDINKVYADFLIETLAYSYSQTPPKYAKPGKNVVVRLCSAKSDYGLPLTDTSNKEFRDELAKWSAISEHLYIWNYVANYPEYLYPNPTLKVYSPNIRMFEKNKAIGVFMQGDSWNQSTCFLRLRAWVNSHLLWDPGRDQKTLVKEFMDGYYGPAGKYLLDYLELVETVYAAKSSPNWMKPEDIYNGYQLFGKAIEAANGNEVLLERINRERLPLDYLAIKYADKLREWSLANNKKIPPVENMKDTVAGFIESAKKHNVGAYGENRSLEPFLKIWQLTMGMDIKSPAELGDLSKVATRDLQESNATLYLEGTSVNMVDDPDASNTLAFEMQPGGLIWALQWRIDEDTAGKWHCYSLVKTNRIASSGTAFTTGIYDQKASKPITDLTVKIEDMPNGKYKLIDYGVQQLTSGSYFWFSPADNPQEVKSFYVDRVFLVAE